jgi:amidohydrolase
MKPVDATIIRLRRDLHRHPEISGAETATARRIADFFRALAPDQTLTGLGGHGLAFVFAGERPGPTVMLRCELDAVPIEETGRADWCSVNRGVSHACGHDGHMAILAAVGLELAARRSPRGRVVLLFQPAEETGQGAAAVLADERLPALAPDVVLALHNLPGFPRGTVVTRPGTFNCASRGMEVILQGHTAHAAQPETGRSPADAMCRLIDAFAALAPGADPRDSDTFATVVGARLGRAATFGTAPDRAAIQTTLRSATDDGMRRLTDQTEALVKGIAASRALAAEIAYRDIFPATVNHPGAVAIVQRAAAGHPLRIAERPFRWSEDFGRLSARFRGALFGLGAGESLPALHNPDYDFPDGLIATGAAVLHTILRNSLA